MAIISQDVYAENMTRDSTEVQRLDEQFALITENIGYLLHPTVRAKLPPRACIADVGTGTAAFLRSLIDEWPEATLHGYDISSGLFPPILPSDVRLFLYDARQDVPSYLQGKYDLVHVRLIAAELSALEWTGVVKNLSQLLKPGGVMQWEECDFTAVRHLPGNPNSTIETASAMGQMVLSAMRPRFEYGWSDLVADMRAAGLDNVHTEVVAADRVYATRSRLTANGMEAIFAWARLQSARGSDGALSMDHLGQLEQKAYDDIQSGCYVTFDVHIAWGFRPE